MSEIIRGHDYSRAECGQSNISKTVNEDIVLEKRSI